MARFINSIISHDRDSVIKSTMVSPRSISKRSKSFSSLSFFLHQYLLILEHLNGVVPSHTTVGGTASNKNDLRLASLGLQDRRGAKCTGASRTGLVSEGKGSSLSSENRG